MQVGVDKGIKKSLRCGCPNGPTAREERSLSVVVDTTKKRPSTYDESGAVQLPLNEDPPFGVAPGEAHPTLQTDAFKELINKLSWALGSTYRLQYGSTHNPVRKYAQRIAKKVLADHGYPGKIAKSVDNSDPTF